MPSLTSRTNQISAENSGESAQTFDFPNDQRRVRTAPSAGALDSGRLAQPVERLVYTEDVGGSSPSSPTIPPFKEIALTRGYITQVSPAHYEWLSSFRWWPIVISPKTTYAIRSEGPRLAKRWLYMHRQILGEPPCKVDHRDWNGLHNWWENLRPANNQQNSAYRRANVDNLHGGLKGITRYRDGYKSAITVGGRRIHLGCRKTREEAARLYDAAAVLHFGEFAVLNFPEVAA